MLTWNETDVIECLGVLPIVEDPAYGFSHAFSVERDGLRLEMIVRQHEGDVDVALYRDGIELPIFHVRLIGCDALRYVTDKRGEYLELAPARCFGGRYDGEAPIPFGVRLAATPHFSVTMFRQPA